jgi:ElaB/YqjD/DUF883 family membrane-anchored ribosome-binding protein
MNKELSAVRDDLSVLADDARALVAATAHVAEDKVVEARKRLSDALERGKRLYGRVREQTVQGAKAADECVHTHPYRAALLAFGVGAIVGLLLTRGSRNGD